MNDKKELMSIGEVAKSLGITRRMILNYEDNDLLNPDIKDGKMANRYYTLDTLTRIRSIRILQNMGLSLREIRSYLNDSADLYPMLARMEALRDELSLNIEKIRERINPVGKSEMRFVTIPRQTVYRRILRSPTVEERTSELRNVGTDAMRKYGIDTTNRMYFIEYPLSDPDLISYCAAIPDGGQGEFVAEMPETQALCIFHHGAYEKLPEVRESLLAYAEEQGISLSGVCRHIYLEGPPQRNDPRQFITQVALPMADWRKNQTSI